MVGKPIKDQSKVVSAGAAWATSSPLPASLPNASSGLPRLPLCPPHSACVLASLPLRVRWTDPLPPPIASAALPQSLRVLRHSCPAFYGRYVPECALIRSSHSSRERAWRATRLSERPTCVSALQSRRWLH